MKPKLKRKKGDPIPLEEIQAEFNIDPFQISEGEIIASEVLYSVLRFACHEIRLNEVCDLENNYLVDKEIQRLTNISIYRDIFYLI